MTSLLGTRNPYESEARLRKALKLADWLDRQIVSIRPADLDRLLSMDVDWWVKAAAAAGTSYPSPKTKRLIVSILRDRRESVDSDPFEGFPS